jgi:hypothetical protein
MRLAQIILGEPSLVAVGLAATSAAGWILKKLFDIERRVIGIEARCQFHQTENER